MAARALAFDLSAVRILLCLVPTHPQHVAARLPKHVGDECVVLTPRRVNVDNVRSDFEVVVHDVLLSAAVLRCRAKRASPRLSADVDHVRYKGGKSSCIECVLRALRPDGSIVVVDHCQHVDWVRHAGSPSSVGDGIELP